MIGVDYEHVGCPVPSVDQIFITILLLYLLLGVLLRPRISVRVGRGGSLSLLPRHQRGY